MELKQQKDSEGRLCYQFHKLTTALSYVQNFRTALDIGCHVGLWSRHLASRFQQVQGFEPVADHRACFALNVLASNVLVHAMALGEEAGFVSMKSDPHSSGDTIVNGPGDIPMMRLDDVLPDIADVDFCKLDLEGHELYALRGAEKLLLRNKPVIVVEQKPGKGRQFGLSDTAACDYLRSLGATQVREIGGDYFFVWK